MCTKIYFTKIRFSIFHNFITGAGHVVSKINDVIFGYNDVNSLSPTYNTEKGLFSCLDSIIGHPEYLDPP